MPSRKRAHEEMAAETTKPEQPQSTVLDRIRNMSEFAALMQYLFFFGKTIKAEETEVEDFEQECLKPSHSDKLSELGLALLKVVSSHRGLTLDIFDEYTRRQYIAKAPERNPFGEDEEPKKFADFDIFTKIRILHQLSIWTLWNPDKIREKMPEIGPDEQAAWRVDPCGWDAEERAYYLFDDDRLYRQTEPPLPEPPKKKTKAKTPKRGSRASRRRLSRVIPDSTPEVDSEDLETKNNETKNEDDDNHSLDYEPNFEGKKWECVAITLNDYNNFLDSIKRSRDPDEKNLHKFITNEIIPILLQKEEDRERKELRRMRELENLHKLASAKRSSRLADKAEKQKEKDALEEAERKRHADLEMAHREQEKQLKLEEAHQSRMMTREQRLRDREMKRILHAEQLEKEQEQLAKLAEEAANGIANTSRISERQLKADVERRRKELEELQEEEEWVFDCSVCGVHGKNIDDGTHSIACEKCGVWQHSACHDISKEKAESDDFHFTCAYCQEKMRNPVPTLKLNFASKDEQQHEIKPKKPRMPKSTTPKPKKITDTAGSQSSPQQNTSPHVNGSGISTPAFPTGVQVSRPTSDINRLAYPGPPPPVPNSMMHHQSPPRPAVPPPPSQHYQFQNTFAPPNGLAQQRHYTQQTQYPPTYQSNYQQYQPPQPYDQHNGVVQSPPTQSAAPVPVHPPYSPPTQGNGIAATNGYSPQTYPQARPSSSHQYQFQAYSTPRPAQREPVANVSPNGYRPPLAATPSSERPVAPMRISGPTTSHSSNPPTPHLPSPHQNRTSPEALRGPYTSSQTALQGSSPGYSPTKPPSPPRPAFRPETDRNITSPPVTLQPQTQPQILSPPVKKLSPILSAPISSMHQSGHSNGQAPHNGIPPQPTPIAQTMPQPSNVASAQRPSILQQSPPSKTLPMLPPINQLIPSSIVQSGPFTQTMRAQPPAQQPLQPPVQHQQREQQQQQPAGQAPPAGGK